MKALISQINRRIRTVPFAILSIIVMVFGFYGIVKLLFVLFPVKELKPDNTWIETVGMMTKYAIGRNGKGYMQYQVNGTRYREMNNINSYGMVRGEKYVILVNPKNHHEYLMKTWQPVYTQKEVTGTCTGKITRVYTFDWAKEDSFTTNHGIEYSYTLPDSVKYDRAQDLPPEYTGIYKRLKKGDTFKVKYLIDNPQRAVMYFDER